jgi:hypothetical protein
MATETQIEVSRDPTGLVTRTVTKQAFAWEDPSDNCRSYRVNQNDGVVTIVEEFFDSMDPVYQLDVSTTTEPIESHAHFTELDPADRSKWKRWTQNRQDPTLNGWDPATSGGELIQYLYYLWQRSIASYFAPRIVVKCTTLENTEPNASLVGKISETGWGGNVGSVNFILLGLSAQQEGVKYRVTREYLSSANGTVWEPSIYS